MMQEDTLLQQLETLLQELSIKLRYENGNFLGGLCKIDEQKILIVNSKLSIEQKIKIITRELSQLNLENIFVIPVIREIIDESQRESNLILEV